MKSREQGAGSLDGSREPSNGGGEGEADGWMLESKRERLGVALVATGNFLRE